MSEALAVISVAQAAGDAAKMLTVAFEAAKAKHDVAALSEADRQQLLAVMLMVSRATSTATQWIMANPQSSNGQI